MDKKYNSYIVMGLQFGNEGKTKISKLLAKDADYVVRASGGNNAYNKIKLKEGEQILDTIPVTVLDNNSKCILGAGTFIDIEELFSELYALERNEKFLDSRLYIDYRANIIMPYHILIDQVKENILGKAVSKSSNHGVTPAYRDKVSKLGLRFVDLLDMSRFSSRLSVILKEKNDLLERYKERGFEFSELMNKYEEYADKLKYMIVDTTNDINVALDKGSKVLFEASQSVMLDIDYGTYPDVSSSSVTTSSICNGAGISPHKISNVIGVIKAYSTRLSDGIFPTEVLYQTKEHIVSAGKEYTNNIVRRCGWLDLAMLKYAVSLNGVTSLNMTKLDVLRGLDKIKLAVAYEIDKIVYQTYPLLISDKKQYEILYKEFDGFDEDISDIRNYDDLPQNCKRYIEYIEGYLGVPIDLISVGPGLDQVIRR